MTTGSDITVLLAAYRDGDRQALDRLMPAMYDDLRSLAQRYMRRESGASTLQATALVHEVYLRLMADSDLAWQNRAHFCAIAANAMRQILVERARARHAVKRGGSRVRVTLTDPLDAGAPPSIDLLALDEALDRLSAVDARQAKIVELRFFGGLTVEETAEALDVSPATVKRGWEVARAWLYRELTQ